MGTTGCNYQRGGGDNGKKKKKRKKKFAIAYCRSKLTKTLSTDPIVDAWAFVDQFRSFLTETMTEDERDDGITKECWLAVPTEDGAGRTGPSPAPSLPVPILTRGPLAGRCADDSAATLDRQTRKKLL